MADSKEVILIDLKVSGDESVQEAINTIGNLEKANKALREERKKVNLDTVEGKARIKELNDTIDKNTATIKENSDKTKQNQLNVGNYTNSIKDAIPALDKMTGGLYGQAKAITATYTAMGPLGLVIGAIGLAIGALTAYFKGSEEGQNNLNKIMNVGTVIFEKFMDVVEAVGGALFKTGEFIVGGFVKALNVVGVTFDEVDKSAEKLSNNEAKRDKQERDLIERRSKVRLEAAKLRRQADESEGKQRKELVEAAIALEMDLSAQELEAAKTRQEIAQQKKDQFGDDKEALKELAEANAALSDAEAAGLENTRKLNKERIDLEEKLLADLQSKRDIATANRHAKSRDAEMTERDIQKISKEVEVKIETDASTSMINLSKKLSEQTAKITAETNANNELQRKKNLEDTIKNGLQIIDAAAEIAQKITDARLGYLKVQENQLAVSLAKEKTILQEAYKSDVDALDAKFKAGEISKEDYDKQILGLNQKYQADVKSAEIEQSKALNEIKRKEFEANKKNAIIQAVADAARAVVSAIASTPGGPIIKGIAAATVAAFAAIQIAQISKSQFVPTTFAKGGKVGTFNGPSHAQGGIDFVGSNGQRINVEGGENFYVLNRGASAHINRLSALNQSYGGASFFGGGRRSFADGGMAASASGIDYQQLAQAMAQQTIIVTVEDINTGQARVAQIKSKADLAA